MGHKLLVSFDIEWDDAVTYDRIYEALQRAIKQGLSNSQWWCETTSFYVVDSAEKSADFAVRIIKASGLRRAKDRLVVINMNGKAGAAFGKIADPTLYSLLPFLKKL